jgi:hypothetical protein
MLHVLAERYPTIEENVMTVTGKYRGTQEYLLAYQELLTAARYDGVVTYQELASLLGLPLQGSHMGKQVGLLLGEVSEDEHQQGRPMLSAVVVGVSGEPGPGFYALAKELGKLLDDTDKEANRRFWRQEKQAVYATWRKKFTV